MLLAILLLVLALAGYVPFGVAIPLAAGSMLIGGAGGYLLQRRLSRLPRLNGAEAMAGLQGEAVSPIDPDGTIRLGSETWKARSNGGGIATGQRVRVLRLEGLRAIVEAEASDGGQHSFG